MRRILSLVALTAALLLITASSALAYLGPYSGQGYDASSYQCSNGSPFSLDSCRQALWAQAVTYTTEPSLYVNVAYSGAYGHDVAGSCSTAQSTEGYSGKYLQAWRIGCAESDFAFSNIVIGSTAP